MQKALFLTNKLFIDRLTLFLLAVPSKSFRSYYTVTPLLKISIEYSKLVVFHQKNNKKQIKLYMSSIIFAFILEGKKGEILFRYSVITIKVQNTLLFIFHKNHNYHVNNIQNLFT